MCVQTTKLDHKVTCQRNGPWLNIQVNQVLHLSLYVPEILKIQTWVDKPKKKWWQSKAKNPKYIIETVHKNGILDQSDYTDRVLWNNITSEINLNLN